MEEGKTKHRKQNYKESDTTSSRIDGSMAGCNHSWSNLRSNYNLKIDEQMFKSQHKAISF